MQFQPFLRGYNIAGYVDGTSPTSERTATEAYDKWDQIVLGWIINSLSEDILHTLAGISTAQEAWAALATVYGSGSQSQVRSLISQLFDIWQNTDLAAYLKRAKDLADRLFALATPVSDDDLVHFVFRGLTSPFRPFIRSVHQRSTPVTFLELHGYC
ncbi:Retrovirus-related Pol polyprotein from transposon RE1 [Linum perenne]